MSESLTIDWRLNSLSRQLEEKESTINGISDALMLLQADTYEILDVDRAFLSLYRVSRDEVRGKTCHEITHHSPLPCFKISKHKLCPLEESFLTGDSSHVEHVHKDIKGNDLYIEISGITYYFAISKELKP
jgi:PAS domain-containing protein